MKKKIKLNKLHNKLINNKVNIYVLLFGLLMCSVLTSVIFYNLGNADGYYEKEKEIDKSNQLDLEKDLIQLDVNEVKDIFLKYLMIKGMFWLPWIVIALLIGWIIHGIF